MNTAFRFLAALLASFILLCAMWVSAAHAEMVCVKRPLEQGHVGEMVTVCDNAASLPRPARAHRVVGKTYIGGQGKQARTGTTVVVARLGVRG